MSTFHGALNAGVADGVVAFPGSAAAGLKQKPCGCQDRNAEEAQRLIETARLATMGRLIGAINHELNTPLGALSNGLDLIWRYFERPCEQIGSKDRAVMEEMRRAVEIACGRIIEVLAELRRFIRFDHAEMQAIDLRQSLDVATELPRLAPGARIAVQREYSEIPLLDGHASEINQALFEVLTNAVESIDGEGSITLGARQEQNEVVLSVSDTGRGIPAAELAQLFEPHLRVKDGRMGITFGLPLAHKIIHEHGGRIQVASAPGRGTTVTIRFPQVKRQAAAVVN